VIADINAELEDPFEEYFDSMIKLSVATHTSIKDYFDMPATRYDLVLERYNEIIKKQELDNKASGF